MVCMVDILETDMATKITIKNDSWVFWIKNIDLSISMKKKTMNRDDLEHEHIFGNTNLQKFKSKFSINNYISTHNMNPIQSLMIRLDWGGERGSRIDLAQNYLIFSQL